MELGVQLTANTVQRFLFLGLQFIISILVPKLLGPQGFGTYSLVLATAGLMATVSSFGLPAGIMYFFSRGQQVHGGWRKLVWISTLLQVVIVLFIELGVKAAGGNYWIWSSPSWVSGLLGLCLFTSIVVNEKLYALFNGSFRLTAYNRTLSAYSLVNLAGVLVLFLGSPYPLLESVIMLVVLVNVLQSLTLAIRSEKLVELKMEESSDTVDWRSFFSYSLLAYAANLFQFFSDKIDLWILFHFSNEEQVGWYAFASKMAQVMMAIPLVFAAVILPFVISKDFRPARLERQFRLMNTLNLGLALGIFVFMALLLPFFFNDRFNGSLVPLLVLLPGMFFRSMVVLLAAYHAGKGDVRYNLGNSLAAFLLVSVLDLVLVPALLKDGAALAMTLASAMVAIHSYRRYIRREGYNWKMVFASREDIGYLREWIGQIKTRKDNGR